MPLKKRNDWRCTKMADKVIYNKKVWLNPDTSAFFFGRIANDDGYKYGNCKIADCNRHIALDMDLNSKKERKRTAKKLNLLSKHLSDLACEIEMLNE